MSRLMTFARSRPASLAARSRSVQSWSSMRTDRCWVFGASGMGALLAGVYVQIRGYRALRCTYTRDRLVYVHQIEFEQGEQMIAALFTVLVIAVAFVIGLIALCGTD